MVFETWLIAPIASLISIASGLILFRYVNNKDNGTGKIKEIAEAVKF